MRFLLLHILIALGALPAQASVSGLEDARDLSVSCEKSAKAELEDMGKEKACIARSAPCDVKDAGILLFHANIDVACKPVSGECPAVEACALQKLSGTFADSVRLKLDPNNATSADGAAVPAEKKSGRVHR